ncbi:hypothetical protein [Microvirga guangxiensis]|nr:hypothetical protein [Microvirga guangxiensis]
MPGIARQFEPHITRSGGAPSQYRFRIQCSQCRQTDIYEASKYTNDSVLKGYFKQRGWLLGRDRSYDLCSACLAKPQSIQAPSKTSESRHVDPGAREQPQDHSVTASKRHRDTADILARHLGDPKALAAEVFRPKEVQQSRPSTSDTSRQPVPGPALSLEVEQALTGMAADLKALRATMELMAEQMGRLVALGGQQIETTARLAPLIVQSAERITSRVQEAFSAVGSPPSSPPQPAEPVGTKGELTSHSAQDHSQTPTSLAESDLGSGATEPLRQAPRPKTSEKQAGKTAVNSVVVKSIPDAKRSDRFYTSIRLPRALWDSAGFQPEDRLLLEWNGKTLNIERAVEGGVKPKSIGEASVILQSWKLGNLNFEKPKVTEADASLRLMGRPSRS